MVLVVVVCVEVRDSVVLCAPEDEAGFEVWVEAVLEGCVVGGVVAEGICDIAISLSQGKSEKAFIA